MAFGRREEWGAAALLEAMVSESVVAECAGAPASVTGLSLARVEVAKGTEELTDGEELSIYAA